MILVLSFADRLSTETISSATWSNIVQDLSSKIHVYKPDENNMESQPMNEGFMLLSDNLKQLPRLSSNKREILPSQNISATTTCTTLIVMKTTKPTSPTAGHISRRLLNDPSYDTDIDTAPSVDQEDTEIDRFLKVDDEELSRQMINIAMTADGSGESTFVSCNFFPSQQNAHLFFSNRRNNRTNIW